MSPNGALDVAVKVLKDCHEVGNRESQQVKLLTEAAIMGQFIHPNIVRLCGLVTITQPVSDYYIMKSKIYYLRIRF